MPLPLAQAVPLSNPGLAPQRLQKNCQVCGFQNLEVDLRCQKCGRRLQPLHAPELTGSVEAVAPAIAAEFGAWVAVLVYAYEATGPLSVGVVAVAQLIPAALLAPVVATIGEHFARDRALAVGYAVASLATAAVGVAMLAEVPPLLVYALAVVQLTSLTTIRPIQAAILPALVGTAEQLTALLQACGFGKVRMLPTRIPLQVRMLVAEAV